MNFETLHHVAVPVTDLARAKTFYTGVLGLKEIPRPAFSFAGAWYQVDDGGRHIHLIVVERRPVNGDVQLENADGHLALRVKSFRQALAYLESKTLPMRVTIDGPTGFPQIHVMDPDGNVIEINAEEMD
jgi:catechol 2,3-dioxygenase-like lactoylglutathione lyase family enzyme